jgi:hypothetical protein
MRLDRPDLPGDPLSADSADQCGATLREAISELERLNRETERTFLIVGGKLATSMEALNFMSANLQSVAALISGERGRNAAQALHSVLDLARGMGARGGEDSGLLGNISAEGKRLKKTLAQFEGIVAAFHSLGLLTRIETARLGKASADFGNLAEDVRLLARNVETRVDSALDTAGELTPRLESALRDVAALQEGQARELPVVIEQVLQSLASFGEMQRLTHEASVRLASESGEIAAAFQRLVVSLQFQDITRQQVEHVIDVLRRLSAVAGRQSGTTAVILELQLSQLSHASGKFGDSVEAVGASLGDITKHVLKMADESRALSGRSGTNSFFQQMERGCSAILASFGQCAHADAATQAMSEDLAEAVARMRGSIEEIQAIEAQMRRTAMNAMISAEHLGQKGEALGALAGSIQQKAYESRQASEALIQTLDAMNGGAKGLSGRGRTALDRAAQEEGLEAMRTATTQLRESQENSYRQIAEIAKRAEILCQDLAEARDGLSIGAEFAGTVNGLQNRLKATIEEMRCGLPSEKEEVLLAGLAELAARYTMQEQHDIHASLTGVMRMAAAPAPAGEPYALVDAGEFGENVELF